MNRRCLIIKVYRFTYTLSNTSLSKLFQPQTVQDVPLSHVNKTTHLEATRGNV